MATFTSVPAFAANISQYGTKLERGTPKAVKEAANAAAVIVRQNGARFHIKGRSGSAFALGAKVEGPYGYAGSFIAYVKADPPGMWAMIEHGTHPHVIKPRRRGRRGSGSKRALSTPYGVFAIVHHPGTGPIGHPWEAAMSQVQRIVPPVFERALVSVF